MASGNLGVILHENGRGVLCGLEEEARARAWVSAFGPNNNNHCIDGSNLLNHAAIEIAIHVDGDVPPVLVLVQHKFHGPEHHSVRNEHRVVRDVPAHADPLPKAIHNVAFVLGIWRTRRERRAVRGEVPRGVKQLCIGAVDRRVVVTYRDVHEAHRSLWDEHALVPVILQRAVRDPDGENGSPSEDLFDHSAQVGQVREIGERRDPASTHHGV